MQGILVKSQTCTIKTALCRSCYLIAKGLRVHLVEHASERTSFEEQYNIFSFLTCES